MRYMGLYGVPLSMSLLSFGMGTMSANYHRCGIMLLLRNVFARKFTSIKIYKIRYIILCIMYHVLFFSTTFIKHIIHVEYVVM